MGWREEELEVFDPGSDMNLNLVVLSETLCSRASGEAGLRSEVLAQSRCKAGGITG